MSTLAERLEQRAADFRARGFVPSNEGAKTPAAQVTGPRAHYLRRDGTTLCGQAAQPANLGGNLPECERCNTEISMLSQWRPWRGP